MKIQVYNVYSEFLKDKYGQKVYKLPINLPLTCPNRDGYLGRGGCSFCGEEGGSFENLSNELSVREQIEKNMIYIRKRYKANKFIPYFQKFSNTYMPMEIFKKYVEEAIVKDVVGISISTRPDCIHDSHLEFLKEIQKKYNVDINIELGLQTVNYHSLKKINRGHTLAEFIHAANKIKAFGFSICAHIILNLPWDNNLDAIENAKILSALEIDQVKLHSLYILKDTELGQQYRDGEFQMISKDEYIERVILFLEYLDPEVVIQRIMGRAPKEDSLFVNWNESWWKIRDEIVYTMEERCTYQGRKFNYLDGKAVKRFVD